MSKKKQYLRDVSPWSLDMVQAMELKSFTDPEGEELSEREQHFQTAGLTWVHFAEIPEDDIEAAVEAGEWHEAVKQFRRRPEALWCMKEVPSVMAKVQEMLGDLESEADS